MGELTPACIVEWRGKDLEYCFPRAEAPFNWARAQSKANTANAERMLCGTCPHTLLGLDDLRDDYAED